MRSLRLVPILGLIAGFFVVAVGGFSAANANHEDGHDEGVGGEKVYVCKYVRTPGEPEVLQTGQNPIEVSVSAIVPNYTGSLEALIGQSFVDGQIRSLVIEVSAGPGGGQGGEPSVEDCPPPDGPEEQLCPPDSDFPDR